MADILKCFYTYVQISSSKIIWILSFSCIFYLLFVHFQEEKKFSSFMFSLTCAFIFVMTLFGRSQGERKDIATPFASYFVAFSGGSPEKKLQIIMNIAMYIPFGFFLLCCFKKAERVKRVMIVALVISGITEVVQYFGGIGLFEFDDIINNVLGATIGALLYKLIIKKSKNV